MYDSDAARDADIETAAALPRAELRELTRSTIERLADELRLVISYEGHVERTPGGQVLSVGELFCIRWRELEIHHADLGASYTRRNWPSTFVDYLFPVVVWDRGASESLVLRTPEGDVPVGAGDGPVVAGTRVDLTWWLLGRGTGEGLTGTLPTLGPWTRRTPAR